MTKIILASKSKIRAELLQNAGLEIECIPADVNESAMKKILSSQDSSPRADDLAELLADAKALDVSRKNPGRWVIGADQTLSCNNLLYDKAHDIADARKKLLALRGTTHSLHSAISCARDGEVVWRHQDAAHLTMRDFSPEYIGKYLALLGDKVLTSVGGYQLEAEGIQLFEEITGNYFTILGLPLLPLLGFLRTAGIVEE